MKATVMLFSTFLAFILGWFGIGYHGPDNFNNQPKQPDMIQQVAAAEDSQDRTEKLLQVAEQQIKSDYQDARFLSTKAEILKMKQQEQTSARVGASIRDKPPDDLARVVISKNQK